MAAISKRFLAKCCSYWTFYNWALDIHSGPTRKNLEVVQVLGCCLNADQSSSSTQYGTLMWFLLLVIIWLKIKRC